MKFYIPLFYEKLSRKLVLLNKTTKTGTLYEEKYIFLLYLSRLFLE